MHRSPLVAVHAAAGAVAFLIIAGFETVTIGVEVLGAPAQIAPVRLGILYVLPVLIAALATAGGTGRLLGGARPAGLVARKLRRMAMVAAIGIAILAPAAIVIYWKARAGQFDTTFTALQAAEIVFGFVNLTLIGLNLRDGLRLTGRLA